MKKNLLLASLALLIGGTSAHAQKFVTGKKWDAMLDNMLTQRAAGQNDNTVQYPTIHGIKSITPEENLNLTVKATDSQAVADFVISNGYTATIITKEVLTVQAPLSFVEKLAEQDNVVSLSSPRHFDLFMTKARTDAGVTKIQEGTGLETPFTGKGVVLGVIDMGFEYKHVAFLDENGDSRVTWLWNRSTSRNTKPSRNIPTSGDAGGGGHATHVTNIAAGSKIEENDFYGVAPGVEIYMIPSNNFAADEVLEDVKWVKETAEADGKPWVVNMSFGSQLGPHDGTTVYDEAIDEMLGPGGLVTAAMGNEGSDRLHTSYTFEEDGTIYILLDPSEASTGAHAFNYFDLWGMAADGQKHLTVRPFLYSSGKYDYFEDNPSWGANGAMYSGIDSQNNKEYYSYRIDMTYLRSISGKSTAKFGLEISGAAGQSFHAWCNPGAGSYSTSSLPGKTRLRGDNDYCVGEGAATIPRAIAVGSYNTAINFYSYNNKTTYSYNTIGGTNSMSTFSSYGPFINESIPKPAIAAPGAVINSALSSKATGFSTADETITDVVTRGARKYYYSAMTGTSMASPFVAGVLCLWLEAYPQLTPEQALQILRETARRDTYIGTSSEWDKRAGYGKIDAYEGLKKVLELSKETNGIHNVGNTLQPVTLNKQADRWQVLFNNDETYADIAIYNTSGQKLHHQHLDNVRQADEATISLSGMPAGVYLINIQTTRSNTTRKVVVQ